MGGVRTVALVAVFLTFAAVPASAAPVAGTLLDEVLDRVEGAADVIEPSAPAEPGVPLSDVSDLMPSDPGCAPPEPPEKPRLLTFEGVPSPPSPPSPPPVPGAPPLVYQKQDGPDCPFSGGSSGGDPGAATSPSVGTSGPAWIDRSPDPRSERPDPVRELRTSGAPGPVDTGAGTTPTWIGLLLAAGVLLLAVPLWGLYRRVSRDDLLENGLRREIRDLVVDEPGVTAADVADGLEVHYDTARHHLRLLCEFDELERVEYGSTIRFFVNHGQLSPTDKRTAAALRTPSQRRLLVDLARDGERSAGVLAERAGIAASTASHHLKRLRNAGLVERRRDGKRVRYRLADGVDTSLFRVA